MQRHPTFMQKRSDDWIENLAWDRNISRSRKFGIPIPVWYSTTGDVILPTDEQLLRGPVDPTVDAPEGHENEENRPEILVLDTRFTS